jgi:hypothetical protein
VSLLANDLPPVSGPFCQQFFEYASPFLPAVKFRFKEALSEMP